MPHLRDETCEFCGQTFSVSSGLGLLPHYRECPERDDIPYERARDEKLMQWGQETQNDERPTTMVSRREYF